MTAEVSPLSYREELVFQGQIGEGAAEFPVESLVVTRWKYRHPTEMTFESVYSAGPA